MQIHYFCWCTFCWFHFFFSSCLVTLLQWNDHRKWRFYRPLHIVLHAIHNIQWNAQPRPSMIVVGPWEPGRASTDRLPLDKATISHDENLRLIVVLPAVTSRLVTYCCVVCSKLLSSTNDGFHTNTHSWALSRAPTRRLVKRNNNVM
jgi:hypothetical protein